MDLRSAVFLACVTDILLFQCILCDNVMEESGMVKWTCVCASGQETQTAASAANCSSACDCSPEASTGDDGEGWTCFCASKGVPQAVSNIQNAGCFTSCNCTSGSPPITKTSRKRISSKAVIVILMLCVVLTTVAFLASMACYFYRKDRFHVQSSLSSSDKDTSWNSATNLISHRSTSVSEYREKIYTEINLFKGLIECASFMFKSRRGTLTGAIIQFSYIELEEATKNFANDNLIGLGGTSNVYRGQLRDGRAVAIKRIKMLSGPDVESGFLTEIELISRLNHCHVVPLIGFCAESRGRHFERLLVFEFMANGNLRDCLDAKQNEPISWVTRIGIALGAARGLEYLHEAAAPRILHRDVKSTNILIDDKFRAKITDLGMAKRLLNDDIASCTSSPARMLGTFGYFAPEYAIIGKASLKSDVFSFGVVLLELMTGRPPIQRSSHKPDESLVIWAIPHLRDSKRVISELPDPLLKGNFPEEEMQIMAYLAKECLQVEADSRPTMSEVVQILSTIAPDHRSKRKSFPVNLFQNTLQAQNSPSSRSMMSAADIEQQERLNRSTSREELRASASNRWESRCSLPLTVDRNLCKEDKKDSDDMVLSAGYMERLILLTSNARSWRASDDETVDLTEPRLESFWQANIRSL